MQFLRHRIIATEVTRWAARRQHNGANILHFNKWRQRSDRTYYMFKSAKCMFLTKLTMLLHPVRKHHCYRATHDALGNCTVHERCAYTRRPEADTSTVRDRA